ncbi:hypothetical protein Patl1_17144 [Pistacia atlantica]|uniref:Uncharacterized protein n=1 Tax=Pistacia atlantica TaxID=434234 RepID=A0ACC1B6C3_9ROSI|nr:hypothetical protein Patl1_17144 [Pistacia atlantica]
MSGEGKVVCVTGASDDPKIKHLHELDGTKERLHIFKANLLEEGSFDSAVDGCEGVFHTASPVTFSANDPQAELIDPAVKGTLNVLRSCAKVQSVKRVVVTSSIASILFNGNPLTPDVNWYLVSKTLAEEASWKFAKENGIDLVTLHPGLVIGPFLHSTLNLSLEVILDITNALEVPKASGRYLLVGRVTQFCEILKILHEHYPTLQLPEKLEAAKYEPTYQISQERAKSLGINFMPWEVSLRDTVECFKEKGFFNV